MSAVPRRDDILGQIRDLQRRVEDLETTGTAALVASTQEGTFTSGISIPQFTTVILTLEIKVPFWASEALVMAAGVLSVFNTAGALREMSGRVRIDGSTASQAQTSIPNNQYGNVTPVGTDVVTDPGETFLIELSATTTEANNIPAFADNQAFLNTIVLFRPPVPEEDI